MLLLLFRDLTRHQRRECVVELQALIEANRVARGQMKKGKLEATSNERVRAVFKDVPPPHKRAKRPPRARPPDAPMDDYPDPSDRK